MGSSVISRRASRSFHIIANFVFLSIIIVSVKVMGIFLLFDRSLDLVERLLDELAVLHVEDPVGVAFDLGVVRHHYACCGAVLTLSLRAHPVDIQNQVHDCNYRRKMKEGLDQQFLLTNA